MKCKILIPLLLICLPAALRAQQEDWDVYMAKFEKGPGSVLLNMALKQAAPQRNFPFILITGVSFKGCDDHGLPLKNQFDDLYKISDSVVSIINRNGTNVFAGTFTYQCERLDYFYIKDTAGIRVKLLKVYQTYFKTFTPYINIKEDKEWTAYTDFLYPNEETLEVIGNQKVILNLVKEGDKPEKPRKVDHWLYFSSDKDRTCFINYSVTKNFKVESKEIVKDAALPFQLQISRTDKVELNSISDITIELRKQAKKCNGAYDGWETFVVK